VTKHRRIPKVDPAFKSLVWDHAAARRAMLETGWREEAGKVVLPDGESATVLLALVNAAYEQDEVHRFEAARRQVDREEELVCQVASSCLITITNLTVPIQSSLILATVTASKLLCDFTAPENFQKRAGSGFTSWATFRTLLKIVCDREQNAAHAAGGGGADSARHNRYTLLKERALLVMVSQGRAKLEETGDGGQYASALRRYLKEHFLPLLLSNHGADGRGAHSGGGGSGGNSPSSPSGGRQSSSMFQPRRSSFANSPRHSYLSGRGSSISRGSTSRMSYLSNADSDTTSLDDVFLGREDSDVPSYFVHFWNLLKKR
jgi:hypothetical protein